MSDQIYKVIEITGTSAAGIDDAIKNAIARASETIHNLKWFEVVETRGAIQDRAIVHWQVTMKVGFALES